MNQELSTNSTLSHYRIVSKIGAGGMGEVYLAQDTSELGRTVALKIVSAEVTKDKDRLQRFTQEARTASNLNHPNILTIHEFGQTESVSFIATEFVDGVTLREHLSSRRLKLIDVLDVAIQIVSALNAAHEAGITHRDLKPENVMIRKDHIVKVLDFGLAKLTQTSGATTESTGSEDATRMQVNTTPGLIMGTVSYMSPEQSVGAAVDQRTDIWSAGVVLYEMIAGCVPFQGKDIHRQIIAIQESDPAPLSQQVEGVPERLEEIVTKCLAKEKDERYQTAKDLLIDLRNLRRKLDVDAEIERTVAPAFRSTSAGTSPSTQGAISANVAASETAASTASSAEYIVTGIRQRKLGLAIAALVLIAAGIGTFLVFRSRPANVAIKSIAVMPFVNESGNADLEYLSDGMTETLINSLSQIPNLSVKARSSVFRYKGKEVDPKKVASELGVQAILTGHVIQRGDQLTLSVELIDGLTENTIWGNKYERKGSDLVSLQSEVARDVSGKLKSKISGADAAKVEKSFTANPEAYQLYLKGIFYWNKRNPESLKRSIEFFNQAIEKDPAYALAYAGLAEAYVLLPEYYAGTPRDCYPKATAAAKRALELDGSVAEARTALAHAFAQDFKFPEAEREFRQAIQMNPNYATAHQWYATVLLVTKRYDESVAEGKRAQEIDPLSLIITTNMAGYYFYQGKYDEALPYAKTTVDMDPNFFLGRNTLGLIYEMKGSYAEALIEAKRVLELNDDPNYLANLAHLYAVSGKRNEALKTLEQMKQIASGGRYISGYSFAVVYIGLGDKDKAIEQLERSFEYRAPDFLYVAVDPYFKDLHSDPRFVDLMHRAGLPE
jgi:serine/threonine protein kinase/TolB-like protein/Flp pilus assembly protein TadD